MLGVEGSVVDDTTGVEKVDPAVAASPPPIPIAACKGNTPCKWKAVKVIQGQVNVAGGCSPTAHSAISIYLTIDKTDHLFVKLDKNAHWFLKGCGGSHVGKGGLLAVDVFHAIRRGFNAVEHVGHPDTAVAEDPTNEDTHEDTDNSDDADDPMDDLDDVVAPAPKAKAKAKANECRSVMRAFKMPIRPPCVADEGNAMTTIYVYRSPATNSQNNNSLFLRSDGLDWLLSYAADELHFQGVVDTFKKTK